MATLELNGKSLATQTMHFKPNVLRLKLNIQKEDNLWQT